MQLHPVLSTLCGALLVAAGASGCTVSHGANRPNTQYGEPAYEPMHYNGAIVYYDDRGDPTYYENGYVRYVPVQHGQYEQYRQHYRAHRRGYVTWTTTHPHPRQDPARDRRERGRDRRSEREHRH